MANFFRKPARGIISDKPKATTKKEWKTETSNIN